jgi:hypothetical protein
MLLFWLKPGDGVQITGSIEDLCDLVGWIIVAIKTGESHPTYVADGGKATVDIVREQ